MRFLQQKIAKPEELPMPLPGVLSVILYPKAARTIAGGRDDKTEAVLLRPVMRRQGSMEKTIMLGIIEGSRITGRPI